MQSMLSGYTFWMSSSKDILKSKFHAQGYNHFQKSRRLLRNLTTNEVEIDKTQLLLEKLRIKLV